MQIRRKLILALGFLVAGLLVGGLSLLFGLSGAATDGLVAFCLAVLAIRGIPYAFDVGPAFVAKEIQDFEVVQPDEPAVRAKEWSDDVASVAISFTIWRHATETHWVPTDPLVRAASGARSGRVAFYESAYKLPAIAVQ